MQTDLLSSGLKLFPCPMNKTILHCSLLLLREMNFAQYWKVHNEKFHVLQANQCCFVYWMHFIQDSLLYQCSSIFCVAYRQNAYQHISQRFEFLTSNFKKFNFDVKNVISFSSIFQYYYAWSSFCHLQNSSPWWTEFQEWQQIMWDCG